MFVLRYGGKLKRIKYADYENDIVRLRNEGVSYANIALWLAENKKEMASVNGVRNFLLKLEIKEKSSK